MNWDWIVDLAADRRVIATVLLTGFLFLIWIGRYGGGRRE
jgi:hypothetical protein